MFSFSNIARSEGDPKIIRFGHSSRSMSDRMARGIGWFSIALGVTELIAAKQLARHLGMQGSEGLIRVCGAREISHGVLTLVPMKQFGLWSRVVGDGLDIAVLMKALRPGNRKRENVGIALAMVIGVAALDIIIAKSATQEHSRDDGQRRSYKDRSGFPKGLSTTKSRSRTARNSGNVRPASNGATVARQPSGQSMHLH